MITPPACSSSETSWNPARLGCKSDTHSSTLLFAPTYCATHRFAARSHATSGGEVRHTKVASRCPLLPPLERLLAPFPAEVRQQLAAMGERTKHALICKRDGQDLRMLFTVVPRAARTAPVATPPPPKRCKQQGLAACWGH